jgi:hypothetical protein
MDSVQYITHQNIDATQLDDVIAVKSVAWPFSYNSQKEWIATNLRPEDIHVLLYDNTRLVAYLNLVHIDFVVDGELFDGLGVGNVCAAEKGNGWGTQLIQAVNRYLVANKRPGVLFCGETLVPFYTNNEWTLLDVQKVVLQERKQESVIHTMVFNLNILFQLFSYSGKLF